MFEQFGLTRGFSVTVNLFATRAWNTMNIAYLQRYTSFFQSLCPVDILAFLQLQNNWFSRPLFRTGRHCLVTRVALARVSYCVRFLFIGTTWYSPLPILNTKCSCLLRYPVSFLLDSATCTSLHLP